MDDYNYATFHAKYYDLATFPGPKTGEKLIDMKLYDLKGKEVKISDYLDKPLILETGSLTCPMYTGRIDTMEQMRKQYPDFNFMLVYVREAHPGERTPAHKTLQDKISEAKKIQPSYDDNRTILVDDVAGTFHKAYGPLPNIIYIFNTEGLVLFRGDWNHDETIKDILKTVAQETVHPEAHIVPESSVNGLFLKTLMKGGFKAFWDIALAYPGIRKLHKSADEQYAEKSNN